MFEEKSLRKMYVHCASQFLGCKTGDEKHERILDLYNSINPLPRGYTVKPTDAWCATFVSAIAHNCAMEAIFPFECSCYYMQLQLAKTGQWIEADDYVPSIGDLILYDWTDHENYKETDCKGVPNHVGIVATVSSNNMTIIEGNFGGGVNQRNIQINSRYIRGFGHLNYSKMCSDWEVEWAVNAGLFKGDENGFRWNDPITREEVARLFCRYHDLK